MITRDDILGAIVDRALADPELTKAIKSALADVVSLPTAKAARLLGYSEAHLRRLPIPYHCESGGERRYRIHDLRQYQRTTTNKP